MGQLVTSGNTEWLDIYAAIGKPAGTPLHIQNQGSGVAFMRADRAPAGDKTGRKVLPDQEVENDEGDAACLAWSNGGVRLFVQVRKV